MGRSTGSHASFGRRRFLAGLGLATTAPVVWDPVRAAAQHRSRLAAITDPTGTTLELSIARPSGPGYVRLVEADPYPQLVREDLVAARSGREGRRVPLASIVHLTDVHVVDAQSPARVEFTDRVPPDGPFGSAFRAQETMSIPVGVAMVERVNAVARGPVTGRAFDVAVSTGDNIDNQQENELDWFMDLLDGGTITPNSGDPDRYEGVQDATLGLGYYNNYWHPDPPPLTNAADSYKTAFGFPELPGLLDAAIRPVDSPGLDIPWYSAYGNHDGLLQGNVPGELPGGIAPLDPVATGAVKITAPASSLDPGDVTALLTALPSVLEDPLVLADPGLVRFVTPDARRRAATLEDWIRRHVDSPPAPGPVGHGYAEEMIDSRRLYYTFPISDAVLGICLDTVNHGGYADGSIGQQQLTWLDRRLADTPDRLVVLFSHHNLQTIGIPLPDPYDPTDPRLGFGELRALLSRYPNVVAWVNGHSHVNRITAVPDANGSSGGFWEISTAAHIDWPEQARLIEIVDNRDGTLSIFGTLIEHAAPARVEVTDPTAATPEQLASLSRELSANDPQFGAASLGQPTDRNVELLIAAPFPVAPSADAVPGSPTTTAARPSAGEARVETLPATGRTSDLVAGTVLGAAAAGVLAWRRRADDDA